MFDYRDFNNSLNPVGQSDAGAQHAIFFLITLREGMAEGSDRAQEIFQPFKRTKSEVWSYFGFYKSPEGNLIEDGHPVCRTKSHCNRNTSNLPSRLV